MLDLLRLRYWNVYFIVALWLHYSEHIHFNVWLNLLLAVLLLLPVPQKLALPRAIIAAVLAAALLYHESWWPSRDQILNKAGDLAGFGWPYVAELVTRVVDIKVVAAIMILAVMGLLFRRYFDPTRWVLAAMLLPLLPATTLFVNSSQTSQAIMPDEATLNRKVSEFFAQEAQRKVAFSPLPADDLAYDLIVLHVCSLSWADLEYIQKQQHPLMQRFDIMFSDFNTVTTYSGPAMIRIMRSSCGQSRHGDMYGPPPKECLTFDQLERAGFNIDLLLNHDGKYGDFLGDLRRLGGLQASVHKLSNPVPYLKSFDETPIANDYEILTRWWQDRLSAPAPRVALYYNTISLHDGNHYVTGDHVDEDSITTYPRRAAVFLDDINKVLDVMEKSGRRAIVVFLPEHGGAIRGDKRQMAGLRELPSPAITRVPIGIKLIGAKTWPEQRSPLVISQSSSYLAVIQLLANFTQHNPFAPNRQPLSKYVANLPSTEFLSDNDSIFILRNKNRYHLRNKDKPWEFYDPT